MNIFSAQFRLLNVLITLIRYDVIFPEELRKRFPLLLRMVGIVIRCFSNPVIQVRQEGVLSAHSKENGLRFAHALERLGPAYIKLGQFMASRSDLFGHQFTEGLSKLKDAAEPFSLTQAKAELKQVFPVEERIFFQTLSEPISAASIAQIHFLYDPQNGQKKAVKILRPNIRKQLEKDIKAFRYAARVLEDKIVSVRRLKPIALVETLVRMLRLETDLRLEAASQSEMRGLFHKWDDVKIPMLDWKHTGETVLVSEWVDGIKLYDHEALEKQGIDRKALARLITQTFLVSALDFGVFHADIHEGNLIALKDGGIAFVDFGIMGRLTRAQRRYLARILYGFLHRDYAFAAEAHFAAGYVPEHHSRAEFASALRAVGEPVFSLSSHEVSMGKVLLHLFEITHLFDMQLRPELVLLQKTMVQVEGTARNLDPYHNIWDSARPVIERWMKRSLHPYNQFSVLLEDAKEMKKAILELPGLLEHVVKSEKRQGRHDIKSKKAKKLKWYFLIQFFLLLLAFAVGFFLRQYY